MELLFDLARLAAGPEPDRGGDNGWLAEFGNSLGDPVSWATMLTWVIAHNLGRTGDSPDHRVTARGLFAEWHLRSTVVDLVMALGRSEYDGQRAADTVDLMIHFAASTSKVGESAGVGPALTEVIAGDAGQAFLRTNRHDGILWFHREAFEELLLWMMLAWVSGDVVEESESAPSKIEVTAAVWRNLGTAAERSGYRMVDFLEVLRVADEIVLEGD